MPLTELAENLGVTQQNVSAKQKKNDMRIFELKSIGNAFGYDLLIEYIKK